MMQVAKQCIVPQQPSSVMTSLYINPQSFYDVSCWAASRQAIHCIGPLPVIGDIMVAWVWGGFSVV